MNILEARDGTFDLLKDGGYRMSPTAHTLLWFLLANGIYDPNSKWFGHVNIYMTSNATLRVATGRNKQAVAGGLKQLEDNGFIRKTRQWRDKGSKQTPDIKLTTPGDFCFTCRKRGHADGVCENVPRATGFRKG